MSSYVLERFGTLALPQYNSTMDLGAGQLFVPNIATSEGGYNPFGTGRLPGQQSQVDHSAMLFRIGGGASVQSQLDALKAVKGKFDRLYRRGADGGLAWTYAWLSAVDAQRRDRDMLQLSVRMTFTLPKPNWHGLHYGAAWVLDSGFYLDTGLRFDDGTTLFALNGSPKAVTLPNVGNYPVRDALITITCGNAPITALTIVCGQAELTYTGTIAATKVLVIDCGAFTVTNDGADGYANFARGANHKLDAWLVLEPGNNAGTVTYTGGGTGSTVLFSYDDGWA